MPTPAKPYLGAIIYIIWDAILVPMEQAHVLNRMSKTRRPKVRAVESLIGHLLSLSFSFGKVFLGITRSLSRWAVDRLPKGQAEIPHHSTKSKHAETHGSCNSGKEHSSVDRARNLSGVHRLDTPSCIQMRRALLGSLLGSVD